MRQGGSVYLLLLSGMRRPSAHITVTEMGIRQTGTTEAVAMWNTSRRKVSNGARPQSQPGCSGRQLRALKLLTFSDVHKQSSCCVMLS